MDHQMLQQRFAALTTAHVADACLRARVPVRCASALLRAVVPGSRLAGRVYPGRPAAAIPGRLRRAVERLVGRASATPLCIVCIPGTHVRHLRRQNAWSDRAAHF
jgi:hypothetical protein